MRSVRSIDLSIYVRSLGLFVRNPALIAAPLVMAIVGIFFNMVLGGAIGPLGGIGGLIAFLLISFGFGVSLILAEQAWRRGKTSFDAAWDEARAKGGAILLAAIGFNFVLYVAGFAGQIISGLGLILEALALYFFIYAIPAAAIGGIPGGAALQVSIERVRASYVPTAIMCIVSIVLFLYVGTYLGAWIGTLLGPAGLVSPTIVSALINALVQALILGYLSLVFSKHYDDVSFRPPRW